MVPSQNWIPTVKKTTYPQIRSLSETHEEDAVFPRQLPAPCSTQHYSRECRRRGALAQRLHGPAAAETPVRARGEPAWGFTWLLRGCFIVAEM